MYSENGYADAEYYVETIPEEAVYDRQLPPLYNSYIKWCESNGLEHIYESGLVGLIEKKFNCHFAFVLVNGVYEKVFLDDEKYKELITKETVSYINNLNEYGIIGSLYKLVYSDYSFWCQNHALEPMLTDDFLNLMKQEKGYVVKLQVNNGDKRKVFVKEEE